MITSFSFSRLVVGGGWCGERAAGIVRSGGPKKDPKQAQAADGVGHLARNAPPARATGAGARKAEADEARAATRARDDATRMVLICCVVGMVRVRVRGRACGLVEGQRSSSSRQVAGSSGVRSDDVAAVAELESERAEGSKIELAASRDRRDGHHPFSSPKVVVHTHTHQASYFACMISTCEQRACETTRAVCEQKRWRGVSECQNPSTRHVDQSGRGCSKADHLGFVHLLTACQPLHT